MIRLFYNNPYILLPSLFLMAKEFKYYPESFGELPVKVIHMDLLFDVFSDHSIVSSNLKAKSKKVLSEITLDADDLIIQEVSCDQGDCSFTYNQKDKKLLIKFDKSIPEGVTFTLTTKSICKPTKNILEGMYFDETPKGAPPTMITQCQQWGFQRLVPCFDDMTAKCTYSTTIIADENYTNIISNGDLIGGRSSVDEGRVKVKYDNTITPMAPYLFFLGVGTYATFKKEVMYADGKKFTLELLVPPDAEKEAADQALEILHDSILWIHLFTGPNKYENLEKSTKLWKLIKERNAGKDVQSEITSLLEGLHLGYQYTGTVYREIGMQNSNFGGMENVGNTTITTNRIMPFKQMGDGGFEYLLNVKVHEFYHNLNGSEVTGRSPFEIWLNEAVTVFIEREFLSFILGKDEQRLGEVFSLLSPRGALAIDATPAAMPVEPDGFNHTDELISDVTYIKAPEFVRMIETTIGKENFVKGLDLYHSRAKHSNATRKDWISAMEEVSGKELQAMAESWLKQTGYPTVEITKEYKDNNLTLTLTQSGQKEGALWQFPLVVAACAKDGKVLAEELFFMKDKTATLTFKDISKPSFLSLNRGYSFYGKVKYSASDEELFLQVMHDTDLINRYMAFYALVDKEKLRLLKDTSAEVDEKIIALYFKLLSDKKLMAEVGPSFVAIFEDVSDDAFAHKYQDLYDMKEKLLKAIATKHEDALLELYTFYSDKKYSGSLVEQRIASLKDRQVKNSCLGILSTLETPKVHELIKKQFSSAVNATDKNVAFSLYLNSTAADKLQLLEKYELEAKTHLVSWENFLVAVGRNDSADYLKVIKRVISSPSFRIEQANDQRAVFAVFAYNKKKSLLTPEGRAFLQESIIKLAAVNEYNTVYMIKTFGTLDKIDELHQVPLVQSIVAILESLSPEKNPSVYNTLKRILLGSPVAIEAFEKVHGKLPIKE